MSNLSDSACPPDLVIPAAVSDATFRETRRLSQYRFSFFRRIRNGRNVSSVFSISGLAAIMDMSKRAIAMLDPHISPGVRSRDKREKAEATIDPDDKIWNTAPDMLEAPISRRRDLVRMYQGQTFVTLKCDRDGLFLPLQSGFDKFAASGTAAHIGLSKRQ